MVASHNEGKVREIADLMRPFGLSVASAAEMGIAEPEETGATFEENARLKAIHAATAASLPALADDSGLVVAALGGAPGIYSARWAGEKRDFAEAMKTVEERLVSVGAVKPEERQASFVAVLSLAFPDGTSEEFRGEVHGTLVFPPRGQNGFGYDPIFLAEGQTRTFGEMHPGVKQALSHRARAFQKLARARLEPS